MTREQWEDKWEDEMGLCYGALCGRCYKKFKLHDKWYAREDMSGTAICAKCWEGTPNTCDKCLKEMPIEQLTVKKAAKKIVKHKTLHLN